MLLAGDELGRSQGGNNNAYCQDNEIGWLNWDKIDKEGEALLEFTRQLVALRHKHIVFHRNRFFHGEIIPGTEVKDVVWLRPDSAEMTDSDWGDASAKALGVRLSGEAGLLHLTDQGEQEPDDTFLIFLNAAHEDVLFHLVEASPEALWRLLIDTSNEGAEPSHNELEAGTEITVKARSLQIFVMEQRSAS